MEETEEPDIAVVVPCQDISNIVNSKEPVSQASKEPVSQASKEPVSQASKQPVSLGSKEPVQCSYCRQWFHNRDANISKERQPMEPSRKRVLYGPLSSVWTGVVH